MAGRDTVGGARGRGADISYVDSKETKVNYAPQLLKPVPSLGSGGFCRSLAVGHRSTITYSDASGDLQGE